MQEIKNLNLADFSGTAGYRIGCTLIPCLNNAADTRVAFNEPPMIAGTTARPALVPVSIPAAFACSRKNLPLACSALTLSGSSFIRRKAASDAAATLGGMPTLYKKPGARNFKWSINAVSPAIYPPQPASVLLSVPIQISTSFPSTPKCSRMP
ncbi:hypothetical protein D3C87_1690920 [compost metagenome]